MPLVMPWLLLFGPLVTAQTPEEAAPLRVQLGDTGRAVTAGFDVTAAFTEKFRKRLNGGIASTIEIRMQLLDSDGNSVATALRRCKLRLDIWNDVLLVRIRDPSRISRRSFLVVDDGLKACGILDDVPFADRALLVRPGGYRMLVEVALNPVSEELIERSREFSSNPQGGTDRPRSLLGGFARLFHSNSTAGGETFLFRSQILQRPGGER